MNSSIKKSTTRSSSRFFVLFLVAGVSVSASVPAELSEVFLAVLLHDFCYTVLVSAGLFLAVLTHKRCVGVLCESLGVELIGYFPDEKEHESHTEQGPGINAGDEHEGSEHHSIVPVVYTAICAALVLEEPVTDGAEEEDAYDIADTVSERNEHEHACVIYAEEVETTDNEVEREPAQGKCECSLPGGESGLFFTCGNVSSLEVLVTAYGFMLCGVESEYHTDKVEAPDEAPENSAATGTTEGKLYAIYLIQNVKYDSENEQNASYYDLKIVGYVHIGKTTELFTVAHKNSFSKNKIRHMITFYEEFVKGFSP